MVSLYCAIRNFVRSTELNYDRSKITEEIGSRVRQAREQATSSITLPVTFTKLRWLSRKLSARKLGVSSIALLQPRSGLFLSSIDDETQERMANKFDVCFMMAKESLPFIKHPALLVFESHHRVDLGPAYRTPDSAKAFTSYIAKSQCQTFLNALSSSGSHFFIFFFMDGTTNAGTIATYIV